MLTPQIEIHGLGPGVLDDWGDRFYFFKDGATDGYETYMVAYPTPQMQRVWSWAGAAFRPASLHSSPRDLWHP